MGLSSPTPSFEFAPMATPTLFMTTVLCIGYNAWRMAGSGASDGLSEGGFLSPRPLFSPVVLLDEKSLRASSFRKKKGIFGFGISSPGA